MNAIEFTAIAHDGVIDIPAQYRGQWNQKLVRVIFLEADADAVQSASTESAGATEVTLSPRKAGVLKGRIKIAPDFNAPLEDFAEYER
jgi:hypothetical protein